LCGERRNGEEEFVIIIRGGDVDRSQAHRAVQFYAKRAAAALSGDGGVGVAGAYDWSCGFCPVRQAVRILSRARGTSKWGCEQLSQWL
jgi:hypothetical protein